MKDNFSERSVQYQKFRPTYPQELYTFLLSLVTVKETAWDCGTGNGQAAQELSKHFTKVYATDISESQISNAIKKENIFYTSESAEQTSFPENFFDLITVAQAIHWFNFNEFYKEVKRTIKLNGILAVIGYGLISIDEHTDKIIRRFYTEIVGPYWDSERKYVDENYQTIPFPFKEIKTPSFENTLQWDFEQLTGYIETWSAVQHYIKANNRNPIKIIDDELKQCWGSDRIKTVKFPILLRVGVVE